MKKKKKHDKILLGKTKLDTIEALTLGSLKLQSHKMVKHTQIICGQLVFDHYVKLALKGLSS